ncbi:class II fructose-bisphosphate aldolase [Motilibacter deserti]|uniref:Class II fructose-bisphosphate aldolase n=1 Tax=Motilibacter deserti TaxID=2714956 RepID=A0ABX0GTY4_9ACTN|nr:class II fructose-bisphosphate aldolase [Motilibacter deserti]NHC14367.1 class II fructose-bisphosphate aldolase [Motilibacter deserti]
MARLVEDARAAGRAIGAFNVIALEHAEAIVDGAERAGLPVILQLSENTADYHGSLAPLARAALQIAEDCDADVVVHLDHATRPELVRQAVELGIPSVMVDASVLPHAQNVGVTAELTRECHEQGVWVEAELGEVGGKDGAHAPGVRTEPGEAAEFVAVTGVDALAVAVGSSHAMLTRDAVLDDALIAELAARAGVPLVLHGSSGVPDAGLASAVRHGMVKVNIATHLNKAMTAAVRAALDANPALVDPRKYLGPGRAAVAAEVARLLGVLAPDASTGV